MTYDVTESIKKCYRPFDIVNYNGNIGFINEVNINSCQPDGHWQRSYSIKWLYQKDQNLHVAWFHDDEITVIGNLMTMIAECMCDSFGGNKSYVERVLFKEK